MNNDELKKKIVEVLKPVIRAGNISCNEENACKKCWFPCEIERTAGRLADALIAAGIGDTSDLEVKCEVLQRDVDSLMRTMEEGADELKEAQRRAEVLERALKSVLLTAGCFHGCIAIDDGETCSMCKLSDDLCLKIILSQAEKEIEFTEQRKNGKR